MTGCFDLNKVNQTLPLLSVGFFPKNPCSLSSSPLRRPWSTASLSSSPIPHYEDHDLQPHYLLPQHTTKTMICSLSDDSDLPTATIQPQSDYRMEEGYNWRKEGCLANIQSPLRHRQRTKDEKSTLRQWWI